MKIEILQNSDKQIDIEYLNTLTAVLENCGGDVRISDVKNDTLFGSASVNDGGYIPDIYIVLGGDGSIIRAAHRAVIHDVPVLGINFGTVGCLAELERGEISTISEIFNGNFRYDRRSLLETEIIRSGKSISGVMTALNDAVIYHGCCTKLVDTEIFTDGALLCKYRSDGVIIATPTGSTGYSMSAGGAVVSPEAEVICITPICAHSFGSRPVIVSDKAEIDVVCTSRGDGKMKLTVDGFEDIPLKSGDKITVRRSGRSIRLIRIGKASAGDFYRKALRKII